MKENTDWSDNLKNIAIALLLLGGATAGAYYFITKAKKDANEKKTNLKSHISGEPEMYAAKLLKSLAPSDYFEFSVNKNDVKVTLREVAVKGIYPEVQQAYSNLTRGDYDLDADLRRRLTQKENDLITLMLENNRANGK